MSQVPRTAVETKQRGSARTDRTGVRTHFARTAFHRTVYSKYRSRLGNEENDGGEPEKGKARSAKDPTCVHFLAKKVSTQEAGEATNAAEETSDPEHYDK